VVEFDDIDTFKLQVLILQPKAGSWELRKHDEERRMVPKNKHSQVAYLPAMHCNLVALFLCNYLCLCIFGTKKKTCFVFAFNPTRPLGLIHRSPSKESFLATECPWPHNTISGKRKDTLIPTESDRSSIILPTAWETK
jgi:hypothetical protein